MTWTARIVSTQENSVPSDSVQLNVEFTDGQRTFTKNYKLSAGQYVGAEDIQTFVTNKLNEIVALYEATQALDTVTTIQSTPQIVTNFQARCVMMQMPAGEGVTLFDLVDTHCKTTGGPALQAWEYANNFYRNGVFVTTLAPTFGLTPEMVDDLFRQAAVIEA